MNNPITKFPIGVFDSGVGGLTVLSALQKQLPNETFLYFGDTARLPYGTKSPDTVIRYARQAIQLLIGQGVKLIVLACNTVSALALHSLQQEFAHIPIVGVIEPGALAACRSSTSGHIVVIATEATVKAESYQQAIRRLRPSAKVIAQGCGLFVALAEEGWLDGPIVEAIAERYLQPLFLNPETHLPDCLVLGCTHFPVLADAIKKVVGQDIFVVDSAHTTASVVIELLEKLGLHHQASESTIMGVTPVRFLVTDDPGRFIKVAAQFLGLNLQAVDITLIDL